MLKSRSNWVSESVGFVLLFNPGVIAFLKSDVFVFLFNPLPLNCAIILEVVSKPQIRSEVKAQADEKAQHI